MNGKIKELAVIATLKHFPSFDNVVLYGDYSKSSYNKEIEDMMFAFAELIVRECANVAAEHDAIDIYEHILDHFNI